MNYEITATIIFTSTIQSFFGTGVLLFGTPILLTLGYSFQEILVILLPISSLINIFQIKKSIYKIDFRFYKNLLIYSLPFIFIFLYLSQHISLNISYFVGVFLILISLRQNINYLKNSFNYLIKYEKYYLMITGILHGLTNLGGALLAASVMVRNLSKESKRTTIAVSYLTMAIIQILTIATINSMDLFFQETLFIYWIIGLLIFIFVEKYFFISLDEKMYMKYSNIFLLMIGLLLLIKNLI